MSVDIVNLIESNPITKFSGDYQSKLVEKVKKNFTNYEQQLFLSSFYCYLKYDTKKDFIIDLDNVWRWLGFSQKVNAKLLLEKQFKIEIDYKKLLLLQQKQDEKTHGGHNKETFMLNIETFKKFCLKAGTKKADEDHDYFIKLENIMFEIAKEESEELRQQLMQIENIKNKEMEIKLKNQKNLEREKTLLDKYAMSGALVYIIKVKSYDNGEYIVKIGESRKGILNRYKDHKSKYEECLLLDCFSVDKSKDFERFLHHTFVIRENLVTNLEGHEKETELFLIGKKLTYPMLVKIINDNIDKYNYKVNELLLEIEMLKEKNSSQNNINNEVLSEIIQTNKLLLNKVNNLEQNITLLLDKSNEKQPKLVTGFNQQMPHLGPRLQKINPETLKLVKVYESVTEAMNENKNIKRPSITKAIQENTIYCGYRWQLVERNLDANIIYSIEPTKETKSQNLGYIAKLNQDKTKILNVYLDRKTAATQNGLNGGSLDTPVKHSSIVRGHYYMLYDKCDENIRTQFENQHGQPLLYKDGIGKFNLNQELVQEFICKYKCIKMLQISDKTLTKALQNNIPYGGFFFRNIGSKLFM
jgi:hypothetical protein